MSVAEELTNRRKCRFKLKGVLVAVDDKGPEIAASTMWGKDSHLIVTLENGQQMSSERCELGSKWPIACCQPGKMNEWNSTGRKWHK